jgi:hypothetical protein
MGNMLDGFFKLPRTVDKVTIVVKDGAMDGPTIGTLAITQDQIKEIKKTQPMLYKELHRFFRLDDRYLMEMNLAGITKNLKDLMITRALNETTNLTTLQISFKLDPTKDARVRVTPLDSIALFEELIANVVKTAFESDANVYRVEIESDLLTFDPRWPDSARIASYSINRDEFATINEKWDNLRYKIYDEIDYAPIFLADFIADSTVVSMEYNESSVIYLFDEAAFKTIDTTVGAVEKDATTVISTLLDKYPLIQTVEVHMKAKVPAEEGRVSSDGIHEIIEDFLVVTADRATYGTLDKTKLSNQQFLFNFPVRWDRSAPDLKIRSDLFASKGYFRAIEFPAADEAVVTLDTCLFTVEPTFKGKITSTLIQIKDGRAVMLEDTVYGLLAGSARELIFDIHPPFLETITFNLQRVYRDTTGAETEVKDLGSVTWDKQPEANYWFQTVDPETLEWVQESSDSLDIADDEVLCQS